MQQLVQYGLEGGEREGFGLRARRQSRVSPRAKVVTLLPPLRMMLLLVLFGRNVRGTRPHNALLSEDPHDGAVARSIGPCHACPPDLHNNPSTMLFDNYTITLSLMIA